MKKYIDFICKVGYAVLAVSTLGLAVGTAFHIWSLVCIASIFLGISVMMCLAFIWE